MAHLAKTSMFGAHDPCEGRHLDKSDGRHSRSRGLRVPLLALACALSIAATAAGVWTFADTLAAFRAGAARLATSERVAPQGAGVDAQPAGDGLLQQLTVRENAERKLAESRAALDAAIQREKEVRDALARELRARDNLAGTASQMGDQLRQERIARSAAERTAREAADQLGRVQAAKAMAERLAKEMTEKWDLERKARALAEQSAHSAMAEAARERSAKAAAELAASELRNQLAATGPPPQGILALRDQYEAERRARERIERAAKDAQLHLAQERFSRDATERALKQVQDRLEQTQDRLAAASCWVCPTGAPCARP